VIVVSGQHGSSCPEVKYDFARSGSVISILGAVGDEPGVRCASVITPWSISVDVGVLPAGTYTVTVDIQGGSGA